MHKIKLSKLRPFNIGNKVINKNKVALLTQRENLKYHVVQQFWPHY